MQPALGRLGPRSGAAGPDPPGTAEVGPGGSEVPQVGAAAAGMALVGAAAGPGAAKVVGVDRHGRASRHTANLT